jgi:predicted extracellular nuclease
MTAERLKKRKSFFARDGLLAVIIYLGFIVCVSPSGAKELVVCSQNLHRLGSGDTAKKITSLVERLTDAECDLIAVQEVYGRTRGEAEASLKPLVKAISKVSEAQFDSYLGEAPADQIRNAFLVRRNAGKVVRVQDIADDDLPKLTPLGRPARFSRLPQAIELEVKGKRGPETIVFVNFHFKSKVDGWKDRTGFNFEITRMEMAEAVNNWASDKARKRRGAIVIIGGDRNSRDGEGAAEVLRGARELTDFRNTCRLESESGNALTNCGAAAPRSPDFVELLAEKERELRQKGVSRKGEVTSYRFRGELIRLDEILVEPEDLWLFRRPDGSIAAGSSGTFGEGSDHKLLWAELDL